MTHPIRVRKLLFHVLSISLAALLIWLSLRGVNLTKFWDSLRSAHYEWILPVIGVTLMSHWIRAYRWHVLVTSISNNSNSRIPVSDLFSSVMIGNMVNYALPRVGEVARCTYLSAKRKISFSALLGTVAVERIADTLVLGLGLFTTLLLLHGRFQSLSEQLSLPELPWGWIGFGGLIIALTIYFGLRLKLAAPLRMRLLSSVKLFSDGFRTIYRTPQCWRLIWTTVVMWLMYGLMAYIPLLIFDLQATVSLSYLDGLAIMFIGILGILVPTPGGVGSFHYITILALTTIYGIDQPGAAAYAVFVHGAQLILYLSVGALILLISPATSRVKSER
ncbi:MAG: lysylphosphatidylglycerol synthase transmembrane domain-containing protein [Bacteroidetes bacterium]|nr:lysylphosphatidylglycerol synthase transmembrane domain-containing protein [Bacteroidota bacterium]